MNGNVVGLCARGLFAQTDQRANTRGCRAVSSHLGGILKYRADIDGLRAIAVIPVVLFHAGTPGFDGGYVGVDVFFVISGYLITLLIRSQQERDRFSIAWFYERRIRRIFPALFAVMVFCAIFGWAIMTPNDYQNLGSSIFATSVFLSNVLFWKRSGYFEPGAEQQPLLHTWSLAIEEQFYLLFPILMVLLAKTGKKFIPILGLLMCISFAAAAIFTFFDQVSTFYLSPFRIWELLLGSLLAVNLSSIEMSSAARNGCAFVGLAMILGSVTLYSRETLFPGLSAAIPALGAAMFIYAGEKAPCFVNRCIGLRPIVAVGLVSYSFYLWHFVLLTCGSYLVVGRLTSLQTGALVASSFAIAVLSWRFIEQPFRRPREIFARRQMLFRAAGISICIFALAGLAIRLMNGLDGRLTPQQRQLADAYKAMAAGSVPCSLTTLGAAVRRDFCKLGNRPDQKPTFIVWADSHGIALRRAFFDLAEKEDSAGLLTSSGGCPPLLDIARAGATPDECAKISENVFEFIRSTPSITSVILVARWAYYVEGTTYKDEPTDLYSTKKVSFKNTSGATQKDTRAVVSGALDQTVMRLLGAGKQVWIVGPVPEIGLNFPKALHLQAMGIARETDVAPLRVEFDQRQANVIPMIRSLAQKYAVGIVWPHEILCTDVSCAVTSEGRPLYLDDDHLSNFGAAVIKPAIEKIKIGR